jgi:hypothetical protein
LLGRSWTYAMMVVVSSVFQVLCFPHEGRIVMIDQMSFNHSDSMENLGSMVPLIENSQMTTERIGVGMYPSLMGTFNFSAPVSYIHATPVGYQKLNPSVPITWVGSFRTLYFEDLWVLPSPCEWLKVLCMLGWPCHCLQ